MSNPLSAALKQEEVSSWSEELETSIDGVDRATLEAIEGYRSTNYTFASSKALTVPRLLLKYTFGERIADLGCGPVLPITTLLLPRNSEVVGFDVLPENLKYVEHWLRSGRILSQQNKALNLREQEVKDIDVESRDSFLTQRLQSISGLVPQDVRRKYPASVGVFDMAMQIGSFLCLDTIDDFYLALHEATSILKPGGLMLSVNWLQDRDSTIPLKFNGPISMELDFHSYSRAFEEVGYEVTLAEQTSDITDVARRNGYYSIVYLVARKRLA